MKDQGHHHPHCLQACRLFVIFLQMLYCSHRLLVRVLKGKPRRRSGHLLIIYSLFLLFGTMEGTNALGKVFCD